MKFFEWYKEYALLILGLFLIIWSVYRLYKDKKNGKTVGKKSIIVGAVGIIIIILLSYIVIF